MSLINTNSNYLETMGISKESTIVGVIVSVYYIGCAIGAVIASWLADKEGRKPSIFICLATTSLGNLLMFISGLTTEGESSSWNGYAIGCMLAGRVIMGLGVGGIDAVIPVCEYLPFQCLCLYAVVPWIFSLQAFSAFCYCRKYRSYFYARIVASISQLG